MKSQKGFGVIEALLIVVIVGLLAGVGWYVRNTNGNANRSLDNADKVTETTTSSNPANKTDGDACDKSDNKTKWKLATSSKDTFSICVPGGWTLISDIQSESFQVMPPFTTSDSKEPVIKSSMIGGKDGTSDMFQVFRADKSYLGWTNEKDAEKTSFVLNDGSKGTRYYTRWVNVSTDGIGSIEGEEDYEYLFEKNSKFVHVVYTIHPGTQKHLDTVESVLKTLVIN